MEEAKASCRDPGPPQGDVVGGRAVWDEASSRGGVDRTVSRILVKVAVKSGENPLRRKGKGSLAMFVSRGLADPKAIPNRKWSKGKLVNIPAPEVFCHACELRDRRSTPVSVLVHISRWRVVMT